jgi:hypothetical protein
MVHILKNKENASFELIAVSCNNSDSSLLTLSSATTMVGKTLEASMTGQLALYITMEHTKQLNHYYAHLTCHCRPSLDLNAIKQNLIRI